MNARMGIEREIDAYSDVFWTRCLDCGDGEAYDTLLEAEDAVGAHECPVLVGYGCIWCGEEFTDRAVYLAHAKAELTTGVAHA